MKKLFVLLLLISVKTFQGSSLSVKETTLPYSLHFKTIMPSDLLESISNMSLHEVVEELKHRGFQEEAKDSYFSYHHIEEKPINVHLLIDAFIIMTFLYNVFLAQPPAIPFLLSAAEGT